MIGPLTSQLHLIDIISMFPYIGAAIPQASAGQFRRAGTSPLSLITRQRAVSSAELHHRSARPRSGQRIKSFRQQIG
jgi:hypothetical protein